MSRHEKEDPTVSAPIPLQVSLGEVNLRCIRESRAEPHRRSAPLDQLDWTMQIKQDRRAEGLIAIDHHGISGALLSSDLLREISRGKIRSESPQSDVRGYKKQRHAQRACPGGGVVPATNSEQKRISRHDQQRDSRERSRQP